jgi:hypothetical protein
MWCREQQLPYATFRFDMKLAKAPRHVIPALIRILAPAVFGTFLSKEVRKTVRSLGCLRELMGDNMITYHDSHRHACRDKAARVMPGSRENFNFP